MWLYIYIICSHLENNQLNGALPSSLEDLPNLKELKFFIILCTLSVLPDPPRCFPIYAAIKGFNLGRDRGARGRVHLHSRAIWEETRTCGGWPSTLPCQQCVPRSMLVLHGSTGLGSPPASAFASLNVFFIIWFDLQISVCKCKRIRDYV